MCQKLFFFRQSICERGAKSGIILRTSTSTIKEAGRATQGVILIRLDGGDEIAAISKLDEEDDEPEVNGTDETGPTPGTDQSGPTPETSGTPDENGTTTAI